MREKIGIIRKVDECGRLTIPNEIRREVGIEAGDNCEISLVKVKNKNKSTVVIEVKKQGE